VPTLVLKPGLPKVPTYLSVRRLAFQKLPRGVEFDAEPAEPGRGTVTKEFVT
jgi:hypothetical protein